MQKPASVIEAVAAAMGHMGNSGRGAYGEALDASRIIYGTREMISELVGLGNPKQVAFTCNSTEGAEYGDPWPFWTGGSCNFDGHGAQFGAASVVTGWKKQGCGGVVLAPCDEKGRLRTELLSGLVKENTKALVCTHASNLTGNANDLTALGAFCKERELLFVVDASQTAGVLPIDMKAMNIDVLCFTGHKSLYGPQGTGGYLRTGRGFPSVR